MPPRLLSINVGLPRDISWHGKTVRTALWKNPVAGRVAVSKLNLQGDGQGDLGGHGGPNRPVMVYQMDSYDYWEQQLRRKDFSYGQFGENFTIEGLPDDEVCIGDRYRIGTALFEVSQPRVTCYRVGIRVDDPRMAALLVAHHRPGFYFRVLEEGDVGSGDEILKVADGPERMTVAEIDGVLYLPGHTREQLQRALRIPQLSQGWQGSFTAILQQESSAAPVTGNAGLAPPAGPPPAWPGFRPLKISELQKESASVLSISLVAADDGALAQPLPGQFIILRIHPAPGAPPLLRNYSLSAQPGIDRYRISVKHEANGAASTYLHTQARVGDVLEVAAPRGNFTLGDADTPVVFLSAGVGATPVLAMLHALAAAASAREIWWLFGARDSTEHPFAREARDLVGNLPHGKSFVVYSRPAADDRIGADFDGNGHLDVDLLEKLNVPRAADFYLCGPAAFLKNMIGGLKTWGVSGNRVHSEIFGAAPEITPGIAASSTHPAPHAPEGPAGTGPSVSFARSGLSVNWDPKFASLLDFAEACDVPVRWSCRTGVCHMCESGLIQGAVDYDPDPLDPPAQGNLLLCCSRPQTDIALDL